LPLLKNVTVPEGIPPPDEGVTVAVKVTDCPAADGFKEEAIAMFTAVPIDGMGEPTKGIENGLPGVPVERNAVPVVVPPGKRNTSFVGANETLMAQLDPGLRLEGQAVVAEKFSEARTPTIGIAVSPMLVTVTTCAALTEPIAWLPKARLVG
jgi:hypothetical protein